VLSILTLFPLFAAGIVDTGGNFPSVSLIPGVHLDLRLSPWIFEKIQNGPNVILWGWGKLIHEKTGSKKSRDTVPLRNINKAYPMVLLSGQSNLAGKSLLFISFSIFAFHQEVTNWNY
jgi:hypothetical protein